MAQALPFAETRPPNQRHAYIQSDVTRPGEAKRVIAEIKKWNNGNPPDTVWTVAGSCYPVLFLDATPEKLRAQMDLNYWSHADMAQAILSEWLSPEGVKSTRQRHLIFTASSAALWSIAGYGPYAAPKAALRALADTLYHEVELYTSNVNIHVVLPGTIDSPGLVQETKYKPEITKQLEKDDPVQSPDEVARKALAGLKRGEYLITTNWLAMGMRGCAWAGSPRNNWATDTVVTWISSLAWIFVQKDLIGKVRAYGKKHGHPSTYPKEL
jgi:3-dehydrosphinganine reductase